MKAGIQGGRRRVQGGKQVSDVTMDDIYNAQKKLGELRWEYWKSEVVFSFQWWLLLVTTILMFAIWFKLTNKGNRHVLVLYVFVTVLLATSLDVLGAELMLWDYPKMLLPWGARLASVDCMVGLILSLLYEKFTSWRNFIIAATVTSAFFAFIMEPLTIWLHIYLPYNWKSIYSFPVYIVMSCGIKAFTDFVLRPESSPAR
ncbi:hypothetical protein FHS18_005089 [Paenibacillus phyllosphaerae]|uniref:Uncharacterized protein n=1 Tax=Paenibacillus phyllosphaerae TaxID=274593 RepID=A0A7W5B221_9BACL|nr:hypothetical protein [Paenibacillus phyllosphaerae]MBB3112987.1 hypothetical protein [Paenibacillus phyllosphaerae]